MSIYGVVGVVVGLLINFLVIRPIERRKIRKEILEQEEENNG